MVLVFGSGGNLGSILIKKLQMKSIPVVGLSHSQVDILSDVCVYRAIKSHNPETVINCAAITDVDYCEENKEHAFAVNSDAVYTMASASKKYNAKFIQISTDYIFNGQASAPYTEESETMPLNIYGDSKLSGERMALDRDGVVCRVQWVLGYARPNYLTWIVESLYEGKKIELSTQVGSATEVNYISECLELIHRSASTSGDIFHISSDDFSTRYEIGMFVCELLGFNKDLIKKVDHVNFGRALRPKNVPMSNKKFKRHFGLKGEMSWRDNVVNFMRVKYGYEG